VAIDEDYNLYIISELYPEYSLSTYLEKNKDKLTFEAKLKILFEIARSLDYIHSLNPPVIHRDIKPHNIFISSNLNAKLGDFG
jgi:serine/threonine protein kinase